MRPIKELGKSVINKISYVLFDIDDTITSGGKLMAESYSALWKLYKRGYSLIPVTGRPAGWCDLIIRQWPVRAVVGENGAFVYYCEGEEIKTFTHPSVAHPKTREKLSAVMEACLKAVPGSRVARDQFARIYDLAIDYNEDPPYLGIEAAERIKNICVSMGAQAKISSIHVNAWFGDYDKLKMTRLFFTEILKETDIKESCIFFGDSPNDEPMFEFFPNSCAVANILPFAEKMRHLPNYVTRLDGAEGFAEAAEQILSAGV
ncbi:MAG TPA: HAD-IIB family hydrolase [Clostridiales bacterium]|jgi:HAD superfamily hydrolase (TIGR01484 family)|nr:HAD-IIB family hydrolase [Clostridiales bacterium]